MTISVTSRISTAVSLAWGCLVFVGSAGAMDLRDWGRKYTASERFVVLTQFNSQAVLDKETQLVWQRTPASSPAASWRMAMQTCKDGPIGGRRGWRLPYIHEMASLADPSVPYGTLGLAAGHPFLAVPEGSYWTATRFDTPTSTYAYQVDFLAGGQNFTRNVVYAAYSWCVRGGGAISAY